MIAIGTDITATHRFFSWLSRSEEQLRTFFADSECRALSVCNSEDDKCQFLASRFAVKEAFYKALSQWLQHHQLTQKTFSLRACAPLVWVEKQGEWQMPALAYDTDALAALVGAKIPPFEAQVSLAHEKEYATAVVLLAAQ